MTAPTTPREIIATLIGPRSISMALGGAVSENAVRLWKSKNRIPPRHWPGIARAATHLGITIEVIEAAHRR